VIRFWRRRLHGRGSLRPIDRRAQARRRVEVEVSPALCRGDPRRSRASHRDGIIARNALDQRFAWQRDRSHPFSLRLGGAAIAVLAVLLLLERGSGRVAVAFPLALAALDRPRARRAPAFWPPTPRPPNDPPLPE
jgi:hypothetical protein